MLTSNNELGSRRSRMQILAQILDFCQKSQPRIRIMQNAYTSSKLVSEYLLELKTLGFLKETETGKQFATTEKGLVFLTKWQQLQEMLSLGSDVVPGSRTEALTRRETSGIANDAQSGIQFRPIRKETPVGTP